MKKIIFFFVIVFVAGIVNAQWVQVPSGTIENLNEIQFVNSNTGFIAGNGGVVFKSTNGGQNWTLINTGYSNSNLALHFLDTNIGFVCNNNSYVLSTTNGGINWVNNYCSINLNGICFINQLTGFATTSVGTYPLVASTSGGATWFYFGGSVSTFGKSVRFLNSSFGYFLDNCGADGNWVVITQNAGYNWTGCILNYSTVNFLNSVHFVTTTIGYAVSDSGRIYKTNNGGTDWTCSDSSSDNKLYSVRASNSNRIIAVGKNGFIRATSNGGTSWYNQNSNTAYNLNSIYMLDSMTGFIVGDVGMILKTTDGGSMFVHQIGTELPGTYSLQQNYPNPFNPATKITFRLSNAGLSSLKVFDILGREVATLVNEQLNPGTYSVEWYAGEYPSGIYFYRLQTGKFTDTKRMTLIK